MQRCVVLSGPSRRNCCRNVRVHASRCALWTGSREVRKNNVAAGKDDVSTAASATGATHKSALREFTSYLGRLSGLGGRDPTAVPREKALLKVTNVDDDIASAIRLAVREAEHAVGLRWPPVQDSTDPTDKGAAAHRLKRPRARRKASLPHPRVLSEAYGCTRAWHIVYLLGVLGQLYGSLERNARWKAELGEIQREYLHWCWKYTVRSRFDLRRWRRRLRLRARASVMLLKAVRW